MTPCVRAALEGDLAEIAALDARSFGRCWSLAQWREELGARRARVLVGDEGGYIRGYACVWVVADRCDLQRIAVAPEMRHRGMGAALLRAIVDLARYEACVAVDLEVAKGNKIARLLYEGHKFLKIGVRVAYYRDPPDDAVLYTRYL